MGNTNHRHTDWYGDDRSSDDNDMGLYGGYDAIRNAYTDFPHPATSPPYKYGRNFLVPSKRPAGYVDSDEEQETVSHQNEKPNNYDDYRKVYPSQHPREIPVEKRVPEDHIAANDVSEKHIAANDVSENYLTAVDQVPENYFTALEEISENYLTPVNNVPEDHLTALHHDVNDINHSQVNPTNPKNDNSSQDVLPKSLDINLGDQILRVEIVEEIGRGEFGTVSRAMDKHGISYALKCLYCHDRASYDESVFHEVQILFDLRHPNIVQMYGFDFIDSSAVIVMEYCSNGTLNTRLDNEVEELCQLKWMEQLADALLYLHNNDIVHRDLKTENVLIAQDNDVKIADFGVARHFVCAKEGAVLDDQQYISHYTSIYMRTMAGTPFWIAPEVFDNSYTEKADIFSLGVIFYAICERQFSVYQGERYYGAFTHFMGAEMGLGVVMHSKQEWVAPSFVNLHDKMLRNLICLMLQFNPSSRISLHDIRSEINEAYLRVLTSK